MGNKIEKHLLDMASRVMKKIRKLDADIGTTSEAGGILLSMQHDRKLRNKYCMAGRPW